MLDELVRPAHADDWGCDFLFREVLDDRAAEPVVQHVVFHRADDLAAAREELDHRGVERLDPARVDDGGRDPHFFERRGRFQSRLAHVAERDDRGARTVAEDLGFSDLEDLGLFLRDNSGARAAGIADRDRALVVVDHRPEHVHKLVLVFRLHVDQARNRAQEADVKKPVMGRAVVAGEPGPVHAERHVEVLQGQVVDDHVVGPLHERAVDREKRLHPPHGEAAREDRRVFLGDAHVKKAIRVPLGKPHEPGAGRHGGGDGGDLVVVVGKIGERGSENLGIRRGRRGGRLAGVEMEFPEPVELVWPLERRGVAFALLGQDVEDDRVVLGLQKFERLGEEGGVVPVDRAVIPDAEILEDHAGGKEVFQPDLGLVREFAGAFSGDPLDELRGLVVEVGVGGIRHQAVEILGHGPDIFRDRPLVVVEDDDQALRRRGHVVQGLEADPAGERPVARHADDMLVAAQHVPRGRHPQPGGERRPGMAGPVGIVLALGAEQEPVQPLVLADRRKPFVTAGQQLVDIALVAHIENQLVLRRLEHPVESDRQLDHSEVRPEVAAGRREDADQLPADLRGQLRHGIGRKRLDIGGGGNASEDGSRLWCGHGVRCPAPRSLSIPPRPAHRAR